MTGFVQVDSGAGDGGSVLACADCGSVVAWDKQGQHAGHHRDLADLAEKLAALTRTLKGDVPLRNKVRSG
jgi:hypothetical protein